MANKTSLSIGAVIGLLIAGYLGFNSESNTKTQTTPTEYSSQQSQAPNQSKNDAESFVNQQSKGKDSQGVATIAQAYQQKRGDVQVQASGRVKALLRDDNEGSRHQKFILELENGQTVLVAHNIDLAPRIDDLKKGDLVEFNGEYEYSDKGGVIHWTHRDPQNRHEHGWLKHNGKIYE